MDEENPIISTEDMPKLLGRPLTTGETDNYSLYLEISVERLEQLLCIELTGTSGEDRVYDARSGYSTLFVDPFITGGDADPVVVTIDGSTVDEGDYTIKQWDKRNAPWYNSIVFDERMNGDEVTVSAAWGFGESLPSDLRLLLAKAFALVSSEQVADSRVKSKSNENFSVTYEANRTKEDQFLLDNATVVGKYRQCDMGEIQHGRVRHLY